MCFCNLGGIKVKCLCTLKHNHTSLGNDYQKDVESHMVVLHDNKPLKITPFIIAVTVHQETSTG